VRVAAGNCFPLSLFFWFANSQSSRDYDHGQEFLELFLMSFSCVEQMNPFQLTAVSGMPSLALEVHKDKNLVVLSLPLSLC